jgi:transcriptional regulator with XRE-family HTH domain
MAQETVGNLIRRYRLRQRQIHNGQPWAQEDLAVAIGTDKSHINRIERSRQRPSFQTLVKICEALSLRRDEHGELFSLAGYPLTSPAPTSAEIEEAVRHAEPFLQGAEYGLALADDQHRLWDLNDSLARTFHGYPDRQSCLATIRGLSAIDILLDEHLSGWWSRVLVDLDSFARRHVISFRRSYRYRRDVLEYVTQVERILAHPRLAPIWVELEAGVNEDRNPEFLDHQLLTVNHPEQGCLAIHLWTTHLTLDDRFCLSHFLPADPHARETLRTLATGRLAHAAVVTDLSLARLARYSG